MVVTVTHSKRQWSPTSSHKALHALYGKAPPAPPGSKLNWVSIWKTLFRSCNKIQTRRNHYVKSSDRQISMTTRATAMTQYKICNDLVQAQAPAPARCYHTKKKKNPYTQVQGWDWKTSVRISTVKWSHTDSPRECGVCQHITRDVQSGWAPKYNHLQYLDVYKSSS